MRGTVTIPTWWLWVFLLCGVAALISGTQIVVGWLT
jgi:hypothetical protein